MSYDLTLTIVHEPTKTMVFTAAMSSLQHGMHPPKHLDVFAKIIGAFEPGFHAPHRKLLKELLDTGNCTWDGKSYQWFFCGPYQINVRI